MTDAIAEVSSAGRRRPPPMIWLAAGLEVLVAAGVAWILTRTTSGVPSGHHHHDAMQGMTSGTHDMTAGHWEWSTSVAAVVAAGAAIWWLRRRSVTAGLVAAAGLFAVAVASSVRTLAVGSHLVLMILLEVAATAIPLMIVLAWGRPLRAEAVSARRWPYAWILGWTIAYVTLLIAIHLRPVHNSILAGVALPWWAVALAALIGTAYWSAILRSPAPTRLRRTALVIGQEVAAMIGLVTVLGGGGMMAAGVTAMGVPAGWDHRLGGAVMLAGCAAASVPVLRRLSRDAPDQRAERADS